MTFCIYPIPWDEELADKIEAACDEAWEWVKRGEMPDPDWGNNAAVAEWVKRRYKRAEKDLRAADTWEADELLRRYFEARELFSTAKKDKEALETQVKLMIADSEGVEGLSGEVSWRNTKGRVDTKGLIAWLYDEYNEYTQEVCQSPESLSDLEDKHRSKPGRQLRAKPRKRRVGDGHTG